jgi:NAD(P)-dependent dehydrogenase (short-subunit alcohol dehydrogenase family)
MSVAVVTGAGGALGRAIALRLAGDGHRVALTDVAEGSLKETAEAVVGAVPGAEVLARAVDLCDEVALAAFFAEVRDGLGSVTALVNNAAIYPTVPFLEMEVADYEAVHAVNQRGYWLCAQLAGRQMAASPQDPDRSIVNVASITMHGGWEQLAAYVTTKGGAVALTRALARELGPLGIRVNAVSPGAFKTAAEEIYDDPEAYSAMVVERQSLKRRGSPAELAAVVSFLTGPDAAFVTGQTIEVNGGWVMA